MNETEALEAFLEKLKGINQSLNKPPICNSNFLTVKQASETLQCHESAVRNWIANGQLPVFKYKAILRVRAEELEKFIKSTQHNKQTMNDHKALFAMQQVQEEKIRHTIDTASVEILNDYFQSASNNMERQAAIEVAQDLNMFDLSDALIEQYEVLNKQ